MNERLIYSQTNDPTKWANEDYDVIKFATPEDAKKAEQMFRTVYNEHCMAVALLRSWVAGNGDLHFVTAEQQKELLDESAKFLASIAE